MLCSLAIFSFAVGALWGSGAAFFYAFRGGRAIICSLYSGKDGFLFLAMPLSAGVLLNYALSFFLTFDVLLAVLMLSAGAGYPASYLQLKRLPFNFDRPRLRLLAAFLAVFFVAHARLMLSPLEPGDGRSIWFLHAKFIFANHGSILSVADFSRKSVKYSHVDYPNLAPALAAQFSSHVGFWNEYFPKLALSVMFFLSFLYIAAISSSAGMFLWLSGICMFFTRPLLWNGYMDGYLAIFSVILGVFAGRVLVRPGGETQLNAAVCILVCGVMLGLKTEAALWCAAMVISFGVALLRGRRAAAGAYNPVLTKLPAPAFILGCCILATLGFFLWQYNCRAQGLLNDMTSSPLIATAFRRLAEAPGSLLHIFSYTLLKTDLLWTMLVSLSLYVATNAAAKENFGAFELLFVFSVLQILLLFAVYLGTHNPLIWHLQTSADRTILPAKLILSCVLYSLAAGHSFFSSEQPPTGGNVKHETLNKVQSVLR